MQFNWSTFLFQIINFLVLVFILHKVLYKPITNIIKKRRQAIEEKFKQAGAEREEAEKLKKEYDDKLLEINREQNRILAKARQESEEERTRLIEEARQGADRERTKAIQSLDQEIEKRLGDLQKNIVASATHLAGKLLHQITGEELDQYLIQYTVAKIKDLNTSDLDLSKNDTIDAILFAAQDPDHTVVEQFRAELRKALGMNVDLTVHTEPSMIAGFRLEIGELIIDAGIDRQLGNWQKGLERSLRVSEREHA
jgi:F-type H+-transporting ATPase subunit b